MKLLRYGDQGAERPAVIAAGSDVVLDAGPVTSGYEPDFFASGGVDRLRAAIERGDLPEIDIAGRRIGAPIARPGKIVCIGLNYRDHAAEIGHGDPRRADHLHEGAEHRGRPQRRRAHPAPLGARPTGRSSWPS